MRRHAALRDLRRHRIDLGQQRAAMAGVSTLFLLNAVAADEVTQALIALNVAEEAGVRHVVYPMPVGAKGLAMIDVRDIGEIAALELIRREQSPEPLPLEHLTLVGPQTLTGPDLAAAWSHKPATSSA